MKFIFNTLFFLATLSTPLMAQDIYDLKVSGDYRDRELRQVLDQLQQTHQVHFYYRPAWLPARKVTLTFEETPLRQALDLLLANTGLSHVGYSSFAVVIARTEDLELELTQAYFQARELEKAAPVEEEKPVAARLEKVTIGVPAKEFTAGNVTVMGRVINSGTGKPLPGAFLQIRSHNLTAVSDEEGNYFLNLPRGNYQLGVRSIGFEPRLVQVRVINNARWDIALEPDDLQLEEVVITAAPTDRNIQYLSPGLIKLSTVQIMQIPAFLGEPDVIKGLLTMPGVSTVGEGAGGFNVRGGNVDQNLILLDEALLFNTSHLLGFFSAFSPDALDEVTLYKGHVPAQYGGRLSSVLDVRQRNGNFEQFKAKGGLGVVSSRLVVEGPLVKDKTSVLLGGRISYSDWVLRLMKSPDLRQSSAFFYDFNGRVTQRVSNGAVSLSYYRSADSFRFSDRFGYAWTSQTASLAWNQVYGDNLSSSFSASFGDLRNTSSDPSGIDAFWLTNGLSNYKLKHTFSLAFREKHQVHAGAEFVLYQGLPEVAVPEGPLSVAPGGRVEKDRGREMAVYFNDEYTLNPRLAVAVGLRYALFQQLGARTVYGYRPGEPRSPASLVDSTRYGPGQVIKTYSGLEPRLSLKLTLSPVSSLKLSYNRLNQYLHLISNTTAALPVDLWQVSTLHIPPQQADNYSAGYFRNFRDNDWESSAEVYYRNLKRVVEYRDLATLLLNPRLETELLPGVGKAYGVELFLKKATGKYNGWLSYTYSRTLRRVDGGTPGERVNQGDWFPANFDQPHTLNLVFNAEVNRRNRFSANFTYLTGRPVTAPVTAYLVNGLYVPHYSERNQFRIPDYHRLDVSYTLNTSPFRRQKYNGSFTFSVYNVYSRRNAYSVFFQRNHEFGSNAFRLSVLGSAFPAVTYNFAF